MFTEIDSNRLNYNSNENEYFFRFSEICFTIM